MARRRVLAAILEPDEFELSAAGAEAARQQRDDAVQIRGRVRLDAGAQQVRETGLRGSAVAKPVLIVVRRLLVNPDRILERGDFHGALCVLAQFRTQRVERGLCYLGGGEDVVAALCDPRPERPVVFLPPLTEQKESLHRVAHAQVVTRRRARLYCARCDGLGALVEFRRRQERVEVAQDRAAELLAGSALLD